MNYTINDLGERVIAVGAPGSLERIKVERPKLIKQLNNLYVSSCDCHGRDIDEAIQLIRDNGIEDYRETNAVLVASHYGEEHLSSVT
jgi:hypothetical protein